MQETKLKCLYCIQRHSVSKTYALFQKNIQEKLLLLPFFHRRDSIQRYLQLLYGIKIYFQIFSVLSLSLKSLYIQWYRVITVASTE